MTGRGGTGVSKKAPGTSQDVAALSPESIAGAQIFAAIGDLARARGYARIAVLGSGLLAELDRAGLGSYGGALATVGCRRGAPPWAPGAGTIGPAALKSWAGQGGAALIVAARAVSVPLLARLLALIEASPALEVCFCDYLVWLPGGRKNPMVDALNRAINQSSRLRVSGYILDPEGRPRIVVGGGR